MRKISRKQELKNIEWNKVTDEKCEELGFICQWCGLEGHRDRTSPYWWAYLDGHHIKKRRYGDNSKENCYVCHRIGARMEVKGWNTCHKLITDKNIDVIEFPNKGEWLRRLDEDEAEADEEC